MKPIVIRFKGRKYYLQPAGIAAIAAAVLLVIVLIVVLATRGHKNEEEPEATPEATAETDDYDASAGVLDKKKFDGTVLEETEDAGIKYVESTLFLGDSNTARFLKEINPETKKTYASKQNAIGVVGMGIDAIASFPCMDFSTGRYSMPQSVKILQPERVIITMGTNNLYGTSTDATSFIERYTAGIRAIEKAYPSVDIIVNSIPPVAKNTTYTNVSMKQIDAYNEAIAKMCKDNKWKYLNSAETMKDEKTGYAKDGYMVSADGLHLSNKGLEALFKYIRTHSWITDDDRPKPLAAIPTIIGVPDGLIKTDPLTNKEFTEDPSTIENNVTPEPTATPTPTPSATAIPSASSLTNADSCAAYASYGYSWSSLLKICYPSSNARIAAENEYKAKQQEEQQNTDPQVDPDPNQEPKPDPQPDPDPVPDPQPDPDPEPDPEPQPEQPQQPEQLQPDSNAVPAAVTDPV